MTEKHAKLPSMQMVDGMALYLVGHILWPYWCGVHVHQQPRTNRLDQTEV